VSKKLIFGEFMQRAQKLLTNRQVGFHLKPVGFSTREDQILNAFLANAAGQVT